MTIDKRARAISFPAEINANNGSVEYLLVAKTGKIHESVLRTDVAPHNVHVAMLLIGVRAATDADPKVFFDPDKPLPGDKIAIDVTWQEGGAQTTKPGEDLVQDLATGKPMNRVHWAYNGSRFVEGGFLAQNEGSFISLIADPGALANNPQLGRHNDENWSANTAVVPAIKTPAIVTLRLLGDSAPTSADSQGKSVSKRQEQPESSIQIAPPSTTR